MSNKVEASIEEERLEFLEGDKVIADQVEPRGPNVLSGTSNKIRGMIHDIWIY